MNHTFKSLQTCPVNMLDPIHWSLGYSQLWPAYSQNQAKLNKLCKTSPDDGRSDLDGLVKYWPNRSGPKATRCARISRSSSGRMQLTCYQFPAFRLICALLQTAQIILCSIWSRSKWECKNHGACFRPTFPSPSRSDVNQIQHIYWVSCWSVLYSTILHSWAASLVFLFFVVEYPL